MLIELFLKVLNLSIGAIPLMAAILVLRLIFKKFVPRKVFYLAWILVFIRLMIPFSIESDLSFYSVLPENYAVQSGSSLEFIKDSGETLDFPVLQHPGENNPSVDAVASENAEAAVEKPATSPTVTRSPIEKNLIFSTGWFFGAAALLIFGVAGYLAVLRKIRVEGVPYSEKISLCDFFTTPMVCGFIKPKIILPLTFDFDDEAQLASVLSHENTHIKRFDNLKRLLATFTLYVHWFNPLVWICYWAFIRDMEVSCDEEVLRRSKGDIRGKYAESLVALAGTGTNPLYGGVLSFGETAIKERVKCIMNFKKAKLFIIIICCAVAVALGVIFLTNPTANMDGAVEIISATVGDFTYDGSENIEFSIEVKNNSGKNLYIDNAALISKYYEQTDSFKEFDWTIGPTAGITVVAPGETVKINEVLRPIFVHGDLGKEGGRFLFKYGVYTDVNKNNFVENIEYEFTITPNFDNFSGAVIMDNNFTPPLQHTAEKERLGTEEDLERFISVMESLSEENLAEFSAIYSPSDKNRAANVEKSVAMQFIRLIKETTPYVITTEPPKTDGVLFIYFLTDDHNFYVKWDGRLVFCEKGAEYGIVFGATNTQPVNSMIISIASVAKEQVENPMTGNDTGNIGDNSGNSSDTSSGNSGSSNSIIIPTKSDYNVALPEIGDIESMAVFNNTDKLCIPSFTPDSYEGSKVYDGFFTNVFAGVNKFDPTLDYSKLGAAVTGADSVEFARADGKKYSVNLYENGFTLSGSALSNENRGMYLAEKEVWKDYIQKVKSVYESYDENIPSWLGLINNNNVTEIIAENENGVDDNYGLGKNAVLKILRGTVVKGPAKVINKDAYEYPFFDYVGVHVKFYTGVQYQVYYTCSELAILSSDMQNALIYELKYPDVQYQNLMSGFSNTTFETNPATAKPVIYLYPEKEQSVRVNLDFDGVLTYTYPALGSGWNVIAKPDGSLINKADGNLYRYLFWEGVANYPWSIEKGFVVAGKDSEKFLVEALTKMGLNSYEIADFVTYWVPKMIENEYNLISFSGDEYAKVAKLTVNPKPDTVIRIHMVWKALDNPVDIEPQQLPTYKRSGFTLVEWGGTEIK